MGLWATPRCALATPLLSPPSTSVGQHLDKRASQMTDNRKALGNSCWLKDDVIKIKKQNANDYFMGTEPN